MQREKLFTEVDKLMELTAASEKSLASLPSESLEEMLSSLQVCVFPNCIFYGLLMMMN